MGIDTGLDPGGLGRTDGRDRLLAFPQAPKGLASRVRWQVLRQRRSLGKPSSNTRTSSRSPRRTRVPIGRQLSLGD